MVPTLLTPTNEYTKITYGDIRKNGDFYYNNTIKPNHLGISVLHFSTYFKCAGQSIAANRINRGLYEKGVDSKLVTTLREGINSNNLPPNVFEVSKQTEPFGVYQERVTLYKYPQRLFGLGDNFHTGLVGIDIKKEVAKYNPDIVQLHFINDGFIKLEDLANIDKPIVWRLSDCWAATGGCHFALGCNKYQSGCGGCYVLVSNDESDISKEVWERKQRLFKAIKEKVTFVTPSKWLYDFCKNSSLLKEQHIVHIPNGLDTKNQYFPDLENDFGFPSDKTIILYGAEDAKSNRKGWKYLKEALIALPDKEKYHLVTFGYISQGDCNIPGLSCTSMGPVYETHILRKLYSAASFFVCPSIVEPFGQVVTEAMACGTPVLVFSNTGPGSIIKHLKTGYVAKYKDISDLVNGIHYLSSYPLGRLYARKEAIEVYDISKVTDSYINLYQSLISK